MLTLIFTALSKLYTREKESEFVCEIGRERDRERQRQREGERETDRQTEKEEERYRGF